MTPKKIYDGRFNQAKFNDLVDAAISARMQSGVGYKVKRTSGGTVLDIKPGQSTATIKSFQLIDASEESTKKIRIVYGTIKGEPPDGMVNGDDPPYIVTVTSEGKLYAKVIIDETGAVTARSIVDLAEPPDDDEVYTYYLEIGSYSIVGEDLNIAQARFGPIDAAIVRNYFATDSDEERWMLIWGMYGFID